MKTGFFLDGRGLCDVEIVSRGTIVSPHLYIYIIRCVQAMGCPVGIAGLDGRLDGWVWSRMFF